MRLGEIAREIGGELRGDPDVEIQGVAPIDTAGPGHLTFAADARRVRSLADCRASAALIPPIPDEVPLAAVAHPNPRLALARALALFFQPLRPEPGIHPSAVVDPTAQVGPEVSIGPCCVVGPRAQVGARAVLHANVTVYSEAEIGEDCVLHAGAVVREGCRLGARCVLQGGAQVGGDGFGFVPDEEGRYRSMPQTGIVVLEDDVEVGANATIDRATMGVTQIGRGTKIDNLVQVGHNCSVGEDTIIAALSGLAGSTRVGSGVLMGAGCGLAGHLSVGDGARLAAWTGTSHDIPPNAAVGGAPAVDHRTWLRYVRLFPRLPELLQRIRELEKRLAELSQHDT